MKNCKTFTFVKDDQSYAVLLDGSYVGAICGDDTIGWYIQEGIKQNDGSTQIQKLKKYQSQALAAAAIPEDDFPKGAFAIHWFEHKDTPHENIPKWEVTVWEKIGFTCKGKLLWVGKSDTKEKLQELIHTLGFVRMTKKKELSPIIWVYEIKHPGEPSACLQAYNDTVTVRLISGDPGGKPNEFQEYIRKYLLAWYGGAKVTIKEE